MLKHKKFLSILLIMPLFASFSCAKATEIYSVINHNSEDNKLTYTLPPTWKDAHKAPFDLEFTDINVKFDGSDLSTRVTSINDAKSEGTYFICTSETIPSKSIISNFHVNYNNSQVNTTLTFYLAHLSYVDETKNSQIHLSEKVTINIINEGALMGPWVIPVISIGVAVLVFLMIFFTRRYKIKKEGKI